ncbi:DEAD/DEAH box helicase domain-containing protein, partial [Cardiosporidium cionae]
EKVHFFLLLQLHWKQKHYDEFFNNNFTHFGILLNYQGFKEEITKLLQSISTSSKSKQQFAVQMIFSTATLTADVKALLAEFHLSEMETVEMPRLHKAIASVRHEVVEIKNRVRGQDKLEVLGDVLRMQKTENGKLMIFCNTVQSCRACEHYVRENGWNSRSYHSEMPQITRDQNFEDFRDNTSVSILVCTDLASRGLDIPNLNKVIMFDFPLNPIDFLHREIFTEDVPTFRASLLRISYILKRIPKFKEFRNEKPKWKSAYFSKHFKRFGMDVLIAGRTGRMGKKGHVISLTTKGDRVLALAIQKAIAKKLPLDNLSSKKVDYTKTGRLAYLSSTGRSNEKPSQQYERTTRRPVKNSRRGGWKAPKSQEWHARRSKHMKTLEGGTHSRKIVKPHIHADKMNSASRVRRKQRGAHHTHMQKG